MSSSYVKDSLTVAFATFEVLFDKMQSFASETSKGVANEIEIEVKLKNLKSRKKDLIVEVGEEAYNRYVAKDEQLVSTEKLDKIAELEKEIAETEEKKAEAKKKAKEDAKKDKED
jgi:hypothetical protein